MCCQCEKVVRGTFMEKVELVLWYICAIVFVWGAYRIQHGIYHDTQMVNLLSTLLVFAGSLSLVLGNYLYYVVFRQRRV